MKVLLLNLPWQRDSKWGVRAGSRWPHIKDPAEGDYLPFPFFLAYAVSLLCENGIDAVIIDAIAEEMKEDDFLKRVKREKADFIVIETSIPSFNNDIEITKKISSGNASVILCGPNYEIYNRDFLDKHLFVDYILYGEYEFSLLELISAAKKGEDLSGVKGLIYRKAGKAVKNEKREPFDIDDLPWPHRDTLPMKRYLDAPGEMALPSAQVLASRGCPFKCQFCLWPQVVYQGNHYRARNIKDVADEMEFLVNERGFESIYFDDDTFNVGKERMLKFCDEITKRGLDKIQWAIMARPDLMDEEILIKMRHAGLWAVKYGVESVHQRLIDNIEKNMDLEKSLRMINFTKSLGVKTHLTFTFGLPGETKATIEETIKAVKKLDPFSVQFSITTPFPGTKMHESFDRNGLIVTKDPSYYDGHYESVIRTVNLSPEDLKKAKIKACRMWQDHLRARKGLSGNFIKFMQYCRRHGFYSAALKALRYLNYVVFDRDRYVNMRDI